MLGDRVAVENFYGPSTPHTQHLDIFCVRHEQESKMVFGDTLLDALARNDETAFTSLLNQEGVDPSKHDNILLRRALCQPDTLGWAVARLLAHPRLNINAGLGLVMANLIVNFDTPEGVDDEDTAVSPFLKPVLALRSLNHDLAVLAVLDIGGIETLTKAVDNGLKVSERAAINARNAHDLYAIEIFVHEFPRSQCVRAAAMRDDFHSLRYLINKVPPDEDDDILVEDDGEPLEVTEEDYKSFIEAAEGTRGLQTVLSLVALPVLLTFPSGDDMVEFLFSKIMTHIGAIDKRTVQAEFLNRFEEDIRRAESWSALRRLWVGAVIRAPVHAPDIHAFQRPRQRRRRVHVKAEDTGAEFVEDVETGEIYV